MNYIEWLMSLNLTALGCCSSFEGMRLSHLEEMEQGASSFTSNDLSSKNFAFNKSHRDLTH